MAVEPQISMEMKTTVSKNDDAVYFIYLVKSKDLIEEYRIR